MTNLLSKNLLNLPMNKIWADIHQTHSFATTATKKHIHNSLTHPFSTNKFDYNYDFTQFSHAMENTLQFSHNHKQWKIPYNSLTQFSHASLVEEGERTSLIYTHVLFWFHCLWFITYSLYALVCKVFSSICFKHFHNCFYDIKLIFDKEYPVQWLEKNMFLCSD